ncbi:MAG: glycosyltransferase [Firmicutes bacterium]|nr:glycosyltransferase [Bacillota bacterium]
MSIGIILMSRAPVPGKTKTRLETHLTPGDCAALHNGFLKDLSKMMISLTKRRGDLNLYLSYTPEDSRGMFRDIIPSQFRLFPQYGDDLGIKMFNSLKYVHKLEKGPQIIMGSDLPTLQPEVILRAIKVLEEKDFVIGPSDDGGYYLLGCKRPYRFLFDDMNWGNSNVFEATIESIKERDDFDYGLVDCWWDVDTYPELLKLKYVLSRKEEWTIYPENTAEVLRSIFLKVMANVK